MTETTPTPNNPTGIVVGVDGSDGAAEALRWAWREAEVRGLPVTAVMAWDYLDQRHADGRRVFDPGYSEADAEDALAGAVDAALGADAQGVERRVVCDIPARALLEIGNRAALVVVAARGLGGFKGLLLGSTSQHVLHHATCPVAVVRHDSSVRFSANKRVVVGVDGSPPSLVALRYAMVEAQLRRATLVVVHAWQMPYAGLPPLLGSGYDAALFRQAAGETVDRALSEVDLPTELPVDPSIVNGSPAAAILETGAGADVIVIGSRGLGGFAGMLLGSTSQQVSRHASCAVIITPASPTQSG